MLTKLINKDEKGFTLIELMIVIAIIGILAAIAIPQFSAYRNRAYNSAASADLKNMQTAQEAYYVENGSYVGTATTLKATIYGWSQSLTVTVTGAAGAQAYSFSSYHNSGNKTYTVTGPGGTVTGT